MLAPEMSATIRRLVERWLQGPDKEGIADMVRKAVALPIYSDMSGTVHFLRCDGEILVNFDTPDPPQIEDDPKWRLIALAHGVKKFPELAPLLPNRSPSAIDCPHCGGRGWIAFGGSTDSEFGCEPCATLGWIDEASALGLIATK
jgi:hypothetical protein